MAKIRSFTTIEQSRKLAKILPTESADMYYEITAEEPEWQVFFGKSLSIAMNLFSYRNGHVIPCWSLASLLDVLPNYQLQTQDDGIGMLCSCSGKFNIVTADNPIDVCVAMIEKLKELKML